LEQLIILLLAGITGFLFLHSSWWKAYVESVNEDTEDKVKAQLEGAESYIRWGLLKKEELEYKERGISKAVWIENAAVLIIGSFLVLLLIESWLAPLYLDTAGMLGMYVASVVGGIVMIFLWDKILEGYVDVFLQYVRRNGLDVLRNSDPVKRLMEAMNMSTQKK